MLLIQVCHICSLPFLVLFSSLFRLFFSLRIIRTTGRSEGKNLSNIRLEIKYIILGVDHLLTPPPLPRNGCMFEMINECTSKAWNCLKNKYRKQTAYKQVFKFKKKYFRCWSVLTPMTLSISETFFGWCLDMLWASRCVGVDQKVGD